MNVINIVIGDDHKIFRDGIKSILSREKGIKIVAEGSNGNQVIELAKIHHPNLVIMDIDMGTPNGIETTKLLKQELPDSNVLILSMLGLHDFIIQALEAGATGYILKNAGKDELLTAIKSVANGDSYFSREVSSILIEQINRPLNTRKTQSKIPLSPREIEVIKLIAQEFSNQEIADKLFISTRTVDTHRRNLLEKLSVRNNVGLTKYAINNKLIN